MARPGTGIGGPLKAAWITGAAIVALATAARFAVWEMVMNLAASAWGVVSPWVPGFAVHAGAMGNHVAVAPVVA
ncbi:hypothetical protein DEW08_06670 [Azospirillum thermophilum]|uniref:SPW repeat-containing integral membrane domain-containing protein n=1 Tax=Azospirillum thermophilum TaxID=2202148 RepID=A0A2S2CNF9_9PROT|nr:hypothetical protein DEW08_06670 [Azospirillum thermophilum]